MDQININTVNDYESLKKALNNELNASALHFCRIGYLLKRARDERHILMDSAYSNVNEFALAEFGLDTSQVSRFIRINDRFSIGGYSEHLKSKYEGYGSAKLSLMLLLPDEINEELSPEYSKAEINTIKAEYEEENRISDLEVLMEDSAGVPDEFLTAVVKELNDENEDVAAFFAETMRLAKKMNIEPNEEDIKEAYMPDGDKTYSIRIPGQGRFLINMKPSDISVVNLRAPQDKSTVSWEEFTKLILTDMATRDYPEPEKPKQKPKSKKVEPAKTKIAPVQTENVQEMPKTDEKCTETDENAREEDKQAAGEEDKQAAGPNEAQAAAGDILTSSQTDALQMIDEIRHMIAPDDGSRPDWSDIFGKIAKLSSYLKQFMY